MFVNKSFTARSKSPSHRFNAISTHGRGNPILFDRRATGSGGAELFDSCVGSIAVTRDVVVFARLLVLLSLSTLFVLKSLGFGFDMTASIVMTSDDDEDDEDVVFSSMLLIDPGGGAVGLLFFFTTITASIVTS